MPLKTTIKKDRFAKLKAGDRESAGFIAVVLAEIQNKEKEQGQPLNDEATIKVIESVLKKLDEAIDIYKKNKKDDLVKSEEFKRALLNTYLPEMVSDAVVEKTLRTILKDFENPSMKDMGAIMSAMRQSIQGRADWKAISTTIKQHCNNPT
jgi:uncharacterized protein